MTTYEIKENARETWIFEVEADSPEEALAKYRNHEDVGQICTVSGWSAGKKAGDILVLENGKTLIKRKR